MAAYILRRLLLMVPTIFGIMAISFAIVQFAPAGRWNASLRNCRAMMSARPRALPARKTAALWHQCRRASRGQFQYRGAQGLDPEFIAELEAQFGFDKPVHERFFKMVGDYARFDFGQSYYRDIAVIDLIAEKLPVSITLGLWSTLLTYLISIPLGIAKARRDGTAFDMWTSAVIIVSYAIPGFLFAVALIVLCAGGS